MATTYLSGERVWSQWRTRKNRARAKLKALQLMTTSGVIRPVHMELRHETSRDRISASERVHRDHDAIPYVSTNSSAIDPWQAWSASVLQRFRTLSGGMLHIQRRLLADLQWGPDKAA